MRTRPIEFCLAMLISIVIVVEADALQNPLAQLWAAEAVFQEQPETIGNFDDHMHFLSMFWDSHPVNTPGDPHFKAYYIGKGFDTRLARSFDGINFANVGTVLPNGPPGSFDEAFASFPGVWKDNGTYYLVYEAGGVNINQFPVNIGLATSTDGVNFTKQGIILNHQPGTWESVNIGTPSLYKEGDTWYLYYHGFDGTDVQIGLATGTDLTSLTRAQSTPIIPTSAVGWDSGTVGKRSRIIKEGDYYYMAYEGTTDLNPTFVEASSNSGMARSTDLVNWEKMPLNPILKGNACCFGFDGPEMITIDEDLYIYYRSSLNQTVRAKLVLAD